MQAESTPIGPAQQPKRRVSEWLRRPPTFHRTPDPSGPLSTPEGHFEAVILCHNCATVQANVA